MICMAAAGHRNFGHHAPLWMCIKLEEEKQKEGELEFRLLQIPPTKRHPEDRFHALILMRVIRCGEEPADFNICSPSKHRHRLWSRG